MTDRRFRLQFAAVLAVAAVFRIVYVFVVKRGDDLQGDEIYYQAQAVVIANGKWFESPFPPGGFAADHVPLTALWLSTVSWIDDRAVLAQRLLMALTGVAVVAAIGLVARMLFGQRAALIAAALAAGYGAFWLNDVVLMSETLATAGVLGVLGCTYAYARQRTVRWAAAIGVSIGLAGLARAELLVLGGVLAAAMILLDGSEADDTDSDASQSAAPLLMSMRVLHLALAGIVSLAVLAPWVIRNQVRFEESTVMSTQVGLTVLGANCPPAYSGEFVGFWAIECIELVQVDPGGDQSTASAAYRSYGTEYAVDHVEELPSVVVARVGRGLSVYRPDQMTQINEAEGRARWASWIATIQFWLLAPIAFIGLRRWSSSRPRWPLLVTVGFTLVLFAAVYGIPRFRIPMDVVVVLGAAAAIEHWWASRDATRPAQLPQS